MKINWKFWKRRRVEPTKQQQAIPASWMQEGEMPEEHKEDEDGQS